MNRPAHPMPPEQRAALMQDLIATSVSNGWRVTSRTPDEVQFVRSPRFETLTAIGFFILAGIGLILYVLWYLGQKDRVLYASQDEYGQFHWSGDLKERSVTPVLILAIALAALCVGLTMLPSYL